ncbi:two-component system sensor histidine kinase DesK [Streptomyces sp. 3211.6]|nr:two-component system sensor histidine kinase DesK [Streptomyces sp. 3211.6]
MLSLRWSGSSASRRRLSAEPAARSGPENAAQLSRAEEAIPAPTLARSITVVAVTCYAVISLLNVRAANDSGPVFLACCSCLAVLFVLQLKHSAPGARLASRRSRLLTLSAQALMTYLPLTLFGWEWGGMAGFLAASVLLLTPVRVGWILYAAITLSMVGYPVILGMGVNDTAYFAIATALTGLVVYGLSTLSRLIVALHAARAELARVAVSNERLRFAQDLHDLLGYSLSAITLKSELTARLINASPERAQEEVAGVLDLSRQALADVRTVASGYRDMTLSAEARSARAILTAADITADVDVTATTGLLDPDVDTVLATVLREGITNALRHSKMRHCSIRATVDDDHVSLCLVNDGVGGEPQAVAADSGNGLGNLRLRLAAVGGRMTSHIDDKGFFRLTATAPRVPEATDKAPSPIPAPRVTRRSGAAV